jgi:hypothetical protein
MDRPIALMAARPTPPRTPTPVRSSTPKLAATASAPFLSSVYIYNPSLGQTDATVHEQLVFSHPISLVDGQSKDTEAAATAELDRQLRAIGLAQGIVQFARAFSPEAPVMEVRTQKGFAVPLEVEKGWWMLAVIAVVAVQILTVDCANGGPCARRYHHPVRPMRDNAKCIPSATTSISYVQVFARPIPCALGFHHHTALPILRREHRFILMCTRY